jgi:hypothetical protein
LATTGQTNEALLEALCHNLCVLVQSIYELDIARPGVLERRHYHRLLRPTANPGMGAFAP